MMPDVPASRRIISVGLLFALPLIVIFGVVRVVPALAAFYGSFTDFSGVHAANWVGFSNYWELASSRSFRQALLNTVIYTLGVTLPSTLLGFSLALLLNADILFRGVLRSIFFLPAVVSFVSVATIWAYILNSQFGVLNYLLSTIGFSKVPWLDSGTWAMPSLIAIGIWKSFGYATTIYLAALQGIPAELYEAASLDGSTARQRFAAITWPLMLPVTTFVFLMTAIVSFQAFDQVLVLTGGGPGHATTTVVLETYRNAFEFLRFGYASAMAFVLTLVIAFFSFVLLRLGGRRMRNAT